MTSQSLQFNILAFTHPSEKFTFYFTDKESPDLCRFGSSTVPDEVVAHFGEKDFYYTSFKENRPEFYPVEKAAVPEYSEVITEDGEVLEERVHNSAYTVSVLKKFYNWRLKQYFREKGFLAKRNYIGDTEVWIEQENKWSDLSYRFYDRYTLRVQFKMLSGQWELVLMYNGTSKIFKKSVSDLSTEITSNAFISVIYENRFYKYQRIPDKVARNLSETYPVWNLAIKKELDEPSEKPDKTNKYFKFKKHIQYLIDNFLKTPEFQSVMSVLSFDLIKVAGFRIGEVSSSSNDLLFYDDKTDYTPLYGITRNGPFAFPREKNIHFIFIGHNDDTDVVKLVHEYFDRKKLPFPGIANYTGKGYHADKNLGFRFTDRKNPWPEIRNHISNMKLNPDVRYVAVYISPFSRDTATPSQQGTYYKVKQALLEREIVCQVIDAAHARESEKFIYNAVNMSIAINAKLNGTPWRLDAKTHDELVVGVGAFHNRVTDVKYIASAFSFDNTGKFNRFDHFYENQTKQLAGLIKFTVKKYTSVNPDLQRLVIHFYKNMKRKELEPIERALKDLDLDIPVFVVSINKTESVDYIAFDKDSSLLMPYSGTWINLDDSRYLLFNNTRYRNKQFKTSDGFPFPLKMKIDCTNKALLKDQQIIEGLIGQVYQFSRMYWKSFKQQNLPVTLKYSQMIAEMLPHFEGNTIPDFGKDKLWFL